ncbi:hypothetical protein ACHAWO_003886 [Cyclotella atomus]|uniref:Uncharacterized protein n=1 Tax=Cyclotella atomus TaxID=382360 RepID=A0ABD3MNY1_9STRA
MPSVHYVYATPKTPATPKAPATPFHPGPPPPPMARNTNIIFSSGLSGHARALPVPDLQNLSMHKGGGSIKLAPRMSLWGSDQA